MRLFLLLLLTLAAWPASGQIYSAANQPVKGLTLTIPQQVRVRDSLLTLASLRGSLARERRAWLHASHLYNAALDSLETAYHTSQGEAGELRVAYVGSQAQLASQTKKTAMYRARAHRKGVVNALLSALLAGLVYSRLSSR